MIDSSRRSAIKKLGAMVAGAALPEACDTKPLKSYEGAKVKLNRPVTAIVIGAGNRGNVYASYAQKYPEELKIVGVAEPIEHKIRKFAETYGIPKENCYPTWERVFEVKKFADVVFITTPDNLHYGPAMAAIPLKYDLLLEKPIAQSWKECNDILQAAVKHKSIVAICHVLRYTPYFRKLKELCSSGTLGDIISVQHLEPVEYIHMSHSFVRGPWRNATESTPMIVSKSCHDTDMLRWLIDKNCTRVTSFGRLSYFTSKYAPKGSAQRCIDGCPAEPQCPYSALKIYLKNKWYLGHLNLESGTDAEILDRLKTTRYGVCVYKSDNDVVDHQVCNFEFDGGATAAFSMEGMTHYGGRRTRIMGTKAHLVGDENELEYFDFSTRQLSKWSVDKADISSGHGGGDFGLVHDFLRASQKNEPSLLTSTLQASMESHLMGFMAEKSRLEGGRPVAVAMEGLPEGN